MTSQPPGAAQDGMRHSSNFPLVVMLLAGLGIGWFLSRAFQQDLTGSGGRDGTAGGETLRARRAGRPQTDPAPHGRMAALKAELRKAPKDELPGVVYRILELGDPLERQALLMDAFAGADAATCQALMEQFGKITKDTGRLQHGDWRTGLFLAGKAGGADILNRWIGHGAGGTELQEAIRGFATSDPQGALAWLAAQDEARLPGKDQLLPRLMAGAAMGDPETAIRMMGQLKPGQQDACLEAFTSNLIQSAGLERATDWMLESMRPPAPEDQPNRNTMLENQMFRRVFEASEWYGYELEMATRIARIHQVHPVKPQQVAAMIGRMHGTSALALAENLAKTPVMNDAQTSSLAVTTAVSAASQTEVRAWLAKHPNSPIREAVEQAIGPPGG